ncbi:HIT1 [Candida margitis]|uniref:HIT1 n=1 Tax=Candida margitis TaxID=1775924 RepID=UPI002226EE8D|nr:HIT1 [Candida margitis]KAI5957412.1 HIT1 [Candida margitis]
MDKHVLSVPYRSQLATPELSPSTEGCIVPLIDQVNDSPIEVCYADLVIQLRDKVSQLQTTVETLGQRIIHLERGNALTLPDSQRVSLVRNYPEESRLSDEIGDMQMRHQVASSPQLNTHVLNPPQSPVKQPKKILERIRYFEVLNQTQQALNNKHQFKSAHLKSYHSSTTPTTYNAQAPKKVVAKLTTKETVVRDVSPKNAHPAKEDRLEKLELAVEALKHSLSQLNLGECNIDAEPQQEPVLRVRVNRVQPMEEPNINGSQADHANQPVEDKSNCKFYSKDSVGAVLKMSITSNSHIGKTSINQVDQIQPFRPQRGVTRQRTICTTNESKYKCPTCKVPYCSLACYKSESHKHDEVTTSKPPSIPLPSSVQQIGEPGSKFDKLLQDDKLQYLLKQPALQFHLLSILTILQDGFINNLNQEQKLEVMNLKLNDLRKGGVEQNELVEEFVQRVLELEEE